MPGGFGGRGIEGKILAANYARTHEKPYLGICLGMQVCVPCVPFAVWCTLTALPGFAARLLACLGTCRRVCLVCLLPLLLCGACMCLLCQHAAAAGDGAESAVLAAAVARVPELLRSNKAKPCCWPPVRSADLAPASAVPSCCPQIAVIEFARNVLGMAEANSTEWDQATAHPVVVFMPEGGWAGGGVGGSPQHACQRPAGQPAVVLTP